MIRKLAFRNLRTDWFGTLAAIIGVALGTATVNVVLVLDNSTRRLESRAWSTNPDLEVDLSRTVALRGVLADGRPSSTEDAKEETHEDYQVMRSAIRLGSLSAFMVGALIVFFTFAVIVERRRKEIALLRSLGATSRQVAGVLLLEAAIIGVAGASMGLLMSFPMAVIAAVGGITTTGRSILTGLWFPFKTMLVVSVIGGSCALVGVLRPVLQVLRLDVPATLRPRFLDERAMAPRHQASGITLAVLPFTAMLYVLIRPFFKELLPSLAFLAFEAALVGVMFIVVLVLVPELIRALGTGVGALLPRGPAAARLLILRRVQFLGREIAWSISGLMLVFGLLLSLHIVTRSLKIEVTDWAASAVRPYTFIYAKRPYRVPLSLIPPLPPNVARANFSNRTPWPNAVLAVDRTELIELVAATGRQELVEIAKRLGPSNTIISSMMARRFGIDVGDQLEVESRNGKRAFKVVAVSDDVGYVPHVGPYRNSKTYALIDDDAFSIIEPYTEPPGATIALVDPDVVDGRTPPWGRELWRVDRVPDVHVATGVEFEQDRVRETDRDFVIFDWILFLTTLLAGIGIANNMVLSIHGRRREIALYRVLGMTAKQVRQMFVIEGAFIGLMAGPLAVLLGVPLGYAALQALELVSAFDVRFDLPASYIVLTICGATLIAVGASLYPAGRASTARSAESIHYE